MKAPLEGLSSPEASAAEEVAEKVLSLVGRAFRHDIMSALSSGVLTPEGLKAHFPATTLAAEVLLLQFSHRFVEPDRLQSASRSRRYKAATNCIQLNCELKRTQ